MSYLSVRKNIKKWLGLFFIFSVLAFFHSTSHTLFRRSKKQPAPQTQSSAEKRTDIITDPDTGDLLKITYSPGPKIEMMVENLTKKTVQFHFTNGTVK